MADTATRRGRAQKIAQYTKQDAWGPEINDGAIERLDEMWGTTAVTVNGNVTLSVEQFIEDQARSVTLILTGNGGFAVTTPPVDKPYLVINNCAADVTVKPAGGTAATIRAGTGAWYYTNAAATAGGVVDLPLDKIKTAAAPVSLGGQKITDAGLCTAPNDVARKGYVDGKRLDEFVAPNANVSMNGHKLTGIADGDLTSQDAASVAQVQALIASATVNMPAQTGNSGKFLQTDGTVPSWQKVNLASSAQVDGVLAPANGGTGGILPIANGGTGQATAQAARLALLPSISGNAQRYLQVNSGATDAQWAAIPVPAFVPGTVTTLNNDAAATFSINSSKRQTIFEFVAVIPATDAVGMLVLASTDGTNFNIPISTLNTFNPSTAIAMNNSNSATTGAAIVGAASGGTAIGSDTNEFGYTGRLIFSQRSGTYGFLTGYGYYQQGALGALMHSMSGAKIETTSTITHIRFQFSSGTMESGTIIPITVEA